jgi:hypothetical protein
MANRTRNGAEHQMNRRMEIMDTRITNAARPDVVMMGSAPRPTPTPARVSFSQVLAAGVSGIVQGAELVAGRLPGSPLTATAIRGATTTMSAQVAGMGGGPVNTTPEGPTGIGIPGAGIGGAAGVPTDSAGGIDASIQQSAQMSLYYLSIQQQVDAQNRTFTALSNVLKAEHDTAKSAIGNIHS